MDIFVKLKMVANLVKSSEYFFVLYLINIKTQKQVYQTAAPLRPNAQIAFEHGYVHLRYNRLSLL